MENRVIDLNEEKLLLAEWEDMCNHKVTIKGFKPLSFLPDLKEVSGVVDTVQRADEIDDGSIFLVDVDITVWDVEKHIVYTIRVRSKEMMGGPDWDLLYYAAELHSIGNEDLPYWADSFEEKERLELEDARFPYNY